MLSQQPSAFLSSAAAAAAVKPWRCAGQRSPHEPIMQLARPCSRPNIISSQPAKLLQRVNMRNIGRHWLVRGINGGVWWQNRPRLSTFKIPVAVACLCGLRCRSLSTLCENYHALSVV